jgi:hypothetical protein
MSVPYSSYIEILVSFFDLFMLAEDKTKLTRVMSLIETTIQKKIM